MTYTIFAKGTLTRELCTAADKTIKSGMIESAYDDVISFHDLKSEDIESARTFMKDAGFDVDTDTYEEHIDGSLCRLEKVETATADKTAEEVKQELEIVQTNATDYANIYAARTKDGKTAGTIEVKIAGREAGSIFFQSWLSPYTKRDIRKAWKNRNRIK